MIRALADATSADGNKAHALARLIAAGVRVPDGFVIGAAAFAEIAQLADVAPDAIGHALDEAGQRIAEAVRPAWLADAEARADALGRLAVRSSASLEDGAGGAAAGVFSSVTDVPARGLWDAIRAVWTSALTPLAVAYARRHDARLAVSVIVQRFVPGQRVTVYTRPPGAPRGDELWIQRGEALARVARDAHGAADHDLALAAERAIGADGGADVELVEGDGVWVVQARPIVHPARATRRPPPPILLSALIRDGRAWTWDITHNPDPLSPAQAGLVEAVEQAGQTPYALAVCAGYLYSAPRGAAPAITAPRDAAELRRRIADLEARFAPITEAVESVSEAVARYVAFMTIWSCELSPLVAAARRVLLDRLAAEGVPAADIPARAAALIGPRRVRRDPVMAPAWDVAAPTFAERGHAEKRTWEGAAPDRPAAEATAAPDTAPPGVVGARGDNLTWEGAAPDRPAAGASAAPDIELARAAADAAELDDVWFARAQWLVRRALLARGAKLGLLGDDIFWLPLDTPALEPEDAHRRASAARAAHARAAAWDMPRVVHGAVPDVAQDPNEQAMLRGLGFGARVVGRVVRLASLHDAPMIAAGDVVVTRAITPALAMLVQGCAALVSETGGLLDHGAALARELAIPCVVGCTGAWSRLADHDRVMVDGDAGLVQVE